MNLNVEMFSYHLSREQKIVEKTTYLKKIKLAKTKKKLKKSFIRLKGML